jgi:hypothetical protein
MFPAKLACPANAGTGWGLHWQRASVPRILNRPAQFGPRKSIGTNWAHDPNANVNRTMSHPKHGLAQVIESRSIAVNSS